MAYKIAKHGDFLATRERGRRVREEIEQELESLAPGDTLTLDFSGVEGITVSFGDETVGKLVIARAAGDFTDRFLVLEGVNDDVRETLEAVLIRRKVAAVAIDRSGPQVLGQRDWLPGTLMAAVEMQSFSAGQLAERLGITPQAANNRLKLLVASGAVARERAVPDGGGKEFSYRVVAPVYA